MKKNGYLLIGIAIGFIVCASLVTVYVFASGVIASSSDVTYNNGTSGVPVSNVQGAIDDLYSKSNTSAVLSNSNFVIQGVTPIVQGSYDTSSVTLTRSINITSPGVYIVAVIPAKSGVYNYSNVNLTGMNQITSLGSQNSGQSMTAQYGSDATVYYYKLVATTTGTITGSASFTVNNPWGLTSNKNALGMNVIKIS